MAALAGAVANKHGELISIIADEVRITTTQTLPPAWHALLVSCASSFVLFIVLTALLYFIVIRFAAGLRTSVATVASAAALVLLLLALSSHTPPQCIILANNTQQQRKLNTTHTLGYRDGLSARRHWPPRRDPRQQLSRGKAEW
jgi:hypothetical protein